MVEVSELKISPFPSNFPFENTSFELTLPKKTINNHKEKRIPELN